jgi:CubicO group peptidase (beta-lactamase class C family)
MRKVIVIVVLTFLAASAHAQGSASYWPGAQWREASPESQGLAADLPRRLDAYVSQKLPRTSSVLVIRNGFLVSERYYQGDADTLRVGYSLTKIVVSCLVGTLVDQNVLGRDDRVESLMPSLFTEESEKPSRSITVRHLLTMTAGFDPSMTEGIGTIDIGNLFQIPFAARPGKAFYYSDVSYNILSMIVTEKTGLLASAYAAKSLFAPMGITQYRWRAYQDYTLGGDGLQMTSADFARLGYLVLRKGRWDGRALVSEAWIAEASRALVDTNHSYGDGPMAYGYGWWTGGIAGKPAVWGWGFLDQFICVLPQLDLVVVLTGDEEKTGSRLDLLKDVILPSVSGD